MASTPLNLKNLSFLIVDANEHVRRILVKILRGFGAHAVQYARSADEALAILGRESMDLLLVDMQLPGMDGFALTQQLRATDGPHRTVPIVLLASHARMDDIARARDCGATMVMAKPVSPGGVYDHLLRAAESDRAFVEAEHYAGPDRRFRRKARADGAGRRAGDAPATPSGDSP